MEGSGAVGQQLTCKPEHWNGRRRRRPSPTSGFVAAEKKSSPAARPTRSKKQTTARALLRSHGEKGLRKSDCEKLQRSPSSRHPAQQHRTPKGVGAAEVGGKLTCEPGKWSVFPLRNSNISGCATASRSRAGPTYKWWRRKIRTPDRVRSHERTSSAKNVRGEQAGPVSGEPPHENPSLPEHGHLPRGVTQTTNGWKHPHLLFGRVEPKNRRSKATPTSGSGKANPRHHTQRHKLRLPTGQQITCQVAAKKLSGRRRSEPVLVKRPQAGSKEPAQHQRSRGGGRNADLLRRHLGSSPETDVQLPLARRQRDAGPGTAM